MMKTIDDYPFRDYKIREPDISWIFTGEFSPLDNFALTPVRVDIGFGFGLYRYPTSEHAFASAKARTFTDHSYVSEDDDPGVAKGRGRHITKRRDWEAVRFDVMWKVLQAKFEQHPDVLQLLLSTGERRIMEGNTWGDQVWGVTKTRPGVMSGRNGLGEMLMEIRKAAQK